MFSLSFMFKNMIFALEVVCMIPSLQIKFKKTLWNCVINVKTTWSSYTLTANTPGIGAANYKDGKFVCRHWPWPLTMITGDLVILRWFSWASDRNCNSFLPGMPHIWCSVSLQDQFLRHCIWNPTHSKMTFDPKMTLQDALAYLFLVYGVHGQILSLSDHPPLLQKFMVWCRSYFGSFWRFGL